MERLSGAALFLQSNGRHQAIFSVAGELFLDSADKLGEVVGYRLRIVRSDSSQLVIEIVGNCSEPGQPRKCEMLLTSSF